MLSTDCMVASNAILHDLCAFSFRSRKYGDKFAEKLSAVLPEFTTLRKLE